MLHYAVLHQGARASGHALLQGLLQALHLPLRWNNGNISWKLVGLETWKPVVSVDFQTVLCVESELDVTALTMHATSCCGAHHVHCAHHVCILKFSSYR